MTSQGFDTFFHNYGETFFGRCTVRWKIEPVVVEALPDPNEDADRQNRFMTNPTESEFILNSDGNAEEDGRQVPNDTLYLFRIAAEAALLTNDDAFDSPDALSRAQGFRYIAITNESVFRYVIFYSQEGLKGDLELTHGPDLVIKGDVHSNGAIYLGGGVSGQDWLSLKPANGSTVIGSKTDPVRVNAVNGIFRLQKGLLYSAVNDIDISGTEPSGFNAATFYNATATGLSNESGNYAFYPPPVSSGTNAFEQTHDGTIINPQRVRSDANLATTSSATDDKRTINGIPILGINNGDLVANDSRDVDRIGHNFKRDANKLPPLGFNGFVRSNENGGGVKRLPELMSNRAFEAQKILYEDFDGDPSSDEHDFARPVFFTNNSETTALPATGLPMVEVPGRYARFGLGREDAFFTRQSPYRGWTVTDRSGNPFAIEPGEVGLVIRERPEPELNFYNSTPSVTAEGTIDYIPFAYGKSRRSSIWPFWAMNAMAVGHNNHQVGLGVFSSNNITTAPTDIHLNNRFTTMGYQDGGVITMRSAMDPGPDHAELGGNINGQSRFPYSYYFKDLSSFAANGDPILNAKMDGWSDGKVGFTRDPLFYRDNWALLNLQRPEDTTTNGLIATYFNDRDHNNNWTGPFGGDVYATKVESQINTTNFSQRPSGLKDSYFSVRYQGFLIPLKMVTTPSRCHTMTGHDTG